MELENIIGIQGAWCDKDIFTKVITDNAVKDAVGGVLKLHSFFLEIMFVCLCFGNTTSLETL